MQKAIIIFLVFIYAFSSTGLAVKADYCCNNLKSIKLVFADGAKDKEGCCKIKYQSFKIKDAHAASDVITAPALHYTFIHTANYFFNTAGEVSTLSFVENIHAPPLYQAISIYISNCVFRI